MRLPAVLQQRRMRRPARQLRLPLSRRLRRRALRDRAARDDAVRRVVVSAVRRLRGAGRRRNRLQVQAGTSGRLSELRQGLGVRPQAVPERRRVLERRELVQLLVSARIRR